jgi:hypothetical protein
MKFLLSAVLSVVLISCSLDNDCGECFTPPQEFNFDFIDKNTSENLFFNETFSEDDITIKDESNNEIDFQIINYNGRSILSLNKIGWELDPKTYTIKLSPEVSVVFELDMDRKSENCCTFFIVKEFNVQSFEYTVLTTTRIIQVKI